MDKASQYWPELFSGPINLAIQEEPIFNCKELTIGSECSFLGKTFRKNDKVVLESRLVLNLLQILSIIVTRDDTAFTIGKVAYGVHMEDMHLYSVEVADTIMYRPITCLHDYQPYKVYDNFGFPVIALKHLTSEIGRDS